MVLGLSILVLTLLLPAGASSGQTAAPTSAPARASCAALKDISLPPGAIALPTGGARISSAAAVRLVTGQIYCEVKGAIQPVDPNSFSINFQLNLPDAWNGKAVQFGGGGFNGTVRTGLVVAFAPTDRQPIALGYMTFGSDSGHQGGAAHGVARAAFNAAFALNRESLMNFSGAQLKKTRDAAVAIAGRYYGRTPERTYFVGSSQGGHEALTVAHRWPDDYDGVVAIHPVETGMPLNIGAIMASQKLYGSQGAWLSPEQTTFVGRSVMAACDRLDGVADGIIANVARCRAVFSLESLRCAKGDSSRPACLSAPQLALIKFLVSRSDLGFTIGRARSFGPWPILEGGFSNPNAENVLGKQPVPESPPSAADATMFRLSDAYVRYLVVRDPSFDSLRFVPAEHVDQLRRLSDLQSVGGPDLDAFRQRGGKLLLMQGTQDMAVPPASTIAYYKQLRSRYDRHLRGFVRFYTAAGFGHGDGVFRVAWNSVEALDAWVSQRTPPGDQIVQDTIAEHNGRTRPLCEFPRWPKYKEAGDVNSAASFSCVRGT